MQTPAQKAAFKKMVAANKKRLAVDKRVESVRSKLYGKLRRNPIRKSLHDTRNEVSTRIVFKGRDAEFASDTYAQKVRECNNSGVKIPSPSDWCSYLARSSGKQCTAHCVSSR